MKLKPVQKKPHTRHKVGDVISIGTEEINITQVESLSGAVHYAICRKNPRAAGVKVGWVLSSLFDDFVEASSMEDSSVRFKGRFGDGKKPKKTHGKND